MKASAFIWFIVFAGIIVFGFIWIVLGSGLDIVKAATDPLITNAESQTIFDIVYYAAVAFWALIILLAIIVYGLINSQKAEGVFQ